MSNKGITETGKSHRAGWWMKQWKSVPAAGERTETGRVVSLQPNQGGFSTVFSNPSEDQT